MYPIEVSIIFWRNCRKIVAAVWVEIFLRFFSELQKIVADVLQYNFSTMFLIISRKFVTAVLSRNFLRFSKYRCVNVTDVCRRFLYDLPILTTVLPQIAI